MKLTDAEIINRVLSGDTDSFGLLVDRYSTRVFGLVSKVVPGGIEAPDIVQEIFVRAFTRLPRFERRCGFGTWLYSLAYRYVIDLCRTSAASRAVAVDEESLQAISDSAVDIFLESDDPHLCALPEALDMLTVQDRTLVTLFYFEGMPVADIAVVMDMTPANVKVRLHRIRKQLYILINKLSAQYEG
ncbi:MAG: sigma-70 family RNA polymerase sigma factor [Muribaculaceae bacterium]|nr:sigma-70 family RNA polymerase sigma factor [Muribaculaceae bacterium]